MRLFQKYSGFLRSLKPVYWINNLLHYTSLKKNKTFYNKFGVHKKIWQSISHVDISNPSPERPWLDNEVTENAIRNKKEFQNFPSAVQQKILAWPKKGYIILENYFRTEEVDQVNNEIGLFLKQNKLDYNFTGRKIMNAWKTSSAVKHILEKQQLLELLSFLLGKEVIPFQTINFQKGSEQKPHSDSIHMTTEPLGYLMATWTALEDIAADAGQLIYYPGSHKLSYILGEDFNTGNTLWQLGADKYNNYEEKIAEIINANNLQPQYFNAKKGDVLIWHANLLHGGSAITNPSSTRKSQVCHYYAKDVLCYHEVNERPAILPQ